MSNQLCHTNYVKLCHTNSVPPCLSHQICQTNYVTPTMSHQLCHTNYVKQTLSHQLRHSVTLTTSLCHTNYVSINSSARQLSIYIMHHHHQSFLTTLRDHSSSTHQLAIMYSSYPIITNRTEIHSLIITISSPIYTMCNGSHQHSE